MTEKQFYRKQNDCPYYLIKSDYHLYMLDEIIVLMNNYHQVNKRLKSRITYLERKIERERTSHQKQHEKWDKEAQDEINHLHEENIKIKNSIQEALANERTQIGQNVLRQLIEQME